MIPALLRKLSLCLMVMCVCIAAQAQDARFNPKQYEELVGVSPDYIGTGDINGDGLTDIAIATRHFGSSPNDRQIYIWLQGTGGQLQPKINFPYPQQDDATSLCVADLYKNNKSELILGTSKHIYIYEWKNNGLQLTDSFAAFAMGADGITTGDFDSDSLTDIGVCYWGGGRLTVIYQNGEQGAPWDVHHYNSPTQPTGGWGNVAAGRFGPLMQDALVYVNKQGVVPVNVLTFDTLRQLQNKYDLQAPVGGGFHYAQTAAIVKKDSGPGELWLVYGTWPGNDIAIWRGLQTLPDSNFVTFGSPESLQSANLDCDPGDETVEVNAGWSQITVRSDDSIGYKHPLGSHVQADGVSLGDINNDGKKDICIAGGVGYAALIIFYNITSPCWPASIPATSLQEVKVFPNPAATAVTISGIDNATVEAYDMQGRLAYRCASSLQTTIDVAAWPQGIYTLKLTTHDGQSAVRKLVKY